MYGNCALNIHDPLLDQACPIPRLALGGGFAGDPPSRGGPAEILPFPIDRVRRDAAGDVPQDDAAAPPATTGGLIPPLDPPYWREWMRVILDNHRAVALVE